MFRSLGSQLAIASRNNRKYIVFTTIIVVALVVGLFFAVPGLLTLRPVSTAPLSARFIFDPYPPDVGQTVSFVGTTTGGVSPYGYSWKFGDGSSGTGSPATHTYSSAGTFTVVLNVTDNGSPKQSTTTRQNVTVIASPPPPPSSSPEIKILYSSSYNNSIQPGGIQPSSGNEFLIVHLTIENVGYKNFSANPFADMYVNVSSNSYRVSPAYIFLQYPFPPTNMTNGQTANGDVVFEVPQGTMIFAPSWRLAGNEQITINWIAA